MQRIFSVFFVRVSVSHAYAADEFTPTYCHKLKVIESQPRRKAHRLANALSSNHHQRSSEFQRKFPCDPLGHNWHLPQSLLHALLRTQIRNMLLACCYKRNQVSATKVFFTLLALHLYPDPTMIIVPSDEAENAKRAEAQAAPKVVDIHSVSTCAPAAALLLCRP